MINWNNLEETTRLAELGDAEAQYLLGRMYYHGHRNYLKRNRRIALKWWKLAAENGHIEALCSLGHRHLARGQYPKAMELFRRAVDMGHNKALFSLGLCYWAPQSPAHSEEEAIRLWKQAADQGYAVAAHRIGRCYYTGDGVKQDYDEAVKWFSMYGEDNYDMATCYLHGHGVEKNIDKAVAFFEKAYEESHSWSPRFELAHLYSDGTVMEPDYEKAAYWWQTAAWGDDGEMWHGAPEAQYWLGHYHYEGKGVEKDLSIALDWFYYTVLSFREQNRCCSFDDEPDFVTDARCMLIKHGDTDMIAKVRRAAKNGRNKARALLDECGL